jgi:hypothetical protein
MFKSVAAFVGIAGSVVGALWLTQSATAQPFADAQEIVLPSPYNFSPTIGNTNCYKWNSRAQICSTADGTIQVLTTAGAGTTNRISLGAETSAGVSIRQTAGSNTISFLRGDSASEYSTINTGFLTINGGASTFINGASATRIRPGVDGVLSLANNADSGFTRITFGGTSSAHPALTRHSATQLGTTLADGTGSGDWYANASALTAGTMTATNTGNLRTTTSRYDWTNAMVVALGAALVGDISVATLPAKTIVKNAYVIITGAAVGPATVTVACGRVAAGYIDYIVASDAKAAANTVYGDASGERGTNLTGYDMPSATGTTAVQCHFISTGANLSTVTGSTGSVYLETATLP